MITKEKAEELSRILKAYSEGKTIQIYIDGTVEGGGVFKGWQDITDFDLEYLNQNDFFKGLPSYDYDSSFKMNGLLRIKPEPKLVPFTFEDKDLFKDRWVKVKNSYVVSGSLNKIVNVNSTGVIYINANGSIIKKTYGELLKQYSFEDNSSCGKYI